MVLNEKNTPNLRNQPSILGLNLESKLRSITGCLGPMNGENRLLVTDEPVEFEKQPVEAQTLGKLPINSDESMEYTSNS